VAGLKKSLTITVFIRIAIRGDSHTPKKLFDRKNFSVSLNSVHNHPSLLELLFKERDPHTPKKLFIGSDSEQWLGLENQFRAPRLLVLLSCGAYKKNNLSSSSPEI
jgi:hypothetical protein